MYIVTAGKAFNDIDAFGSAIAYTELLRKQGQEAQAVFIGALNHSVTRLALEQTNDYLSTYTPTLNDRFIYVDISDKEQFAFPKEPESKIVELFDHHYGFEEYWKERLGEHAHLERVGAAATLIWEAFKKHGYEKEISPGSANLLALAIVQNTLNFSSTETHERDLQAFEELTPHLDMTVNWQQRYFQECAEAMEKDFATTLKNDTKRFERYVDEKTFIFSQLEVSEDPLKVLNRHKQEIHTYWQESPNTHRLINIADMASKSSLLYSDDRDWLRGTINPLFTNHIQASDTWILVPIHQRKQILKLLQSIKHSHA